MKAMRYVGAMSCLVATAVFSVPRATAAERGPRTITVTGSGEVSVKPDLATVSVGVVTEADSAADAVSNNNRRMAQLFETLKTQGIAEKDIQTANFSLQPRYKYDNTGKAPPQITGYTVSNQVQIKVRKLASLGETLDALVQSGANQIQGINFSKADPKIPLDDARRMAIADARRKGDVFASAADVAVGAPLEIHEQSMQVPQPIPMRAMAMEAQSAVPVAAGEQTLTATVQVIFALERQGRKEQARDEATK